MPDPCHGAWPVDVEHVSEVGQDFDSLFLGCAVVEVEVVEDFALVYPRECVESQSYLVEADPQLSIAGFVSLWDWIVGYFN